MFEGIRSIVALSSTDNLEIIRSALHSLSLYKRSVATGRLRDLAVVGKVPQEFTPEVLRMLDILWENKEGCGLMLQSLVGIGGEQALAGFDARMAAASDELINSSRVIHRSLTIDILDGVHSLITPERRSYQAVCLSLFYVLASSEIADFSSLLTGSKDSTPLQRTKAFAILRQICPDLTEGFEHDSHIKWVLGFARVQDKAFESAIEQAGDKVGERIYGKAGGWIGGKAFKGARWLINKSKGLDDSSLRAERLVYPETRSSRGFADMPEFVEVSDAELLAWMESRIKTLTKELLNPDVSTLRARWRGAS